MMQTHCLTRKVCCLVSKMVSKDANILLGVALHNPLSIGLDRLNCLFCLIECSRNYRCFHFCTLGDPGLPFQTPNTLERVLEMLRLSTEVVNPHFPINPQDFTVCSHHSQSHCSQHTNLPFGPVSQQNHGKIKILGF